MRTGMLAVTAFAAVVSVGARADAQEPARSGLSTGRTPLGRARIRLALDAVDVPEALRRVARHTGRRFIVLGTVPAVQLTLRSDARLTPEEVWAAFEDALAPHGLAVGPRGALYTLVHTGAARGGPALAASTAEVVRVRHVAAARIAAVLGPGRARGRLRAAGRAGTLVVSGTADEVAQLRALVRALDVPQLGRDMWISPVRHASAGDVARQFDAVFDDPALRRPGGLCDPPPVIAADAVANQLVVLGTERQRMLVLEMVNRD